MSRPVRMANGKRKKTNYRCWQEVERLEPACTPVGVRDGGAAVASSREAPHDPKRQNHRVAQQSRFWA